jgi:hypothetical protein
LVNGAAQIVNLGPDRSNRTASRLAAKRIALVSNPLPHKHFGSTQARIDA